MFHYRKNLKRYRSYPKPAVCVFCETDLAGRKLLETAHAYVVPNRVFYDLWELREVTDHLLVVPKRHVRSLNELNQKERADIMDILCDYEAQNYNVYARAVQSKQRSVEHQHTHLIKTHDKRARGSLSIQKPYIFIKF